MCDMLSSDLSALLAETQREGLGAQLTNLFMSSDAPNVKDLCNEALSDLQQRKHSMTSVEAIRKSQVRPGAANLCAILFAPRRHRTHAPCTL